VKVEHEGTVLKWHWNTELLR